MTCIYIAYIHCISVGTYNTALLSRGRGNACEGPMFSCLLKSSDTNFICHFFIRSQIPELSCCLGSSKSQTGARLLQFIRHSTVMIGNAELQ